MIPASRSAVRILALMVLGLRPAVALSDQAGEGWQHTVDVYVWAANVGTGDSDIGWAALAGVGYSVSDRWKAILTYRHQAWDFDDTVIIDELEFSGPMFGAVFNF